MEFKINVHKITIVIHAVVSMILISMCLYIMYKIFFTNLPPRDSRLTFKLSLILIALSISTLYSIIVFYKIGLTVITADNNQINFRSLFKLKITIDKKELKSITAKTKSLPNLETILEIKTTTRDNTIFFTPKVYLGNPDKLNLQFKNYIDGIKVLTPQ